MDRQSKGSMTLTTIAARPDRMVLKDMLYAQGLFQGAADPLEQFRNKVGSARTAEGQPSDKTVPLEVLSVYFAAEEDAPCFVRDLQVRDDGTIVCLETKRKQLLFMNSALWPESEANIMANDMCSCTAVPGGYAALSADHQHLHELDMNLSTIAVHDIGAAGLNPKLCIVTSLSTGVAILSTTEKRVAFFDHAYRHLTTVDVSHLLRINSGTGFMNGVILPEWCPGKMDYGELLWVSPEDSIISLASDLHMPFCTTLHENGVVVCDLHGLHVINMDDLAVTQRTFLPWKPMLQLIGLQRGYGHEAVLAGDELFVKFEIGIDYIIESRRYCLARFRIPNLSEDAVNGINIKVPCGGSWR